MLPCSPVATSWRASIATGETKSGGLWRPSSRGRQSIRHKSTMAASALRCRKKFLRFFPGGFADETYIDWERDYKWAAHERWMAALEPSTYRMLLADEAYDVIAATAVRIESRTNLLFSFEKMAL